MIDNATTDQSLHLPPKGHVSASRSACGVLYHPGLLGRNSEHRSDVQVANDEFLKAILRHGSSEVAVCVTPHVEWFRQFTALVAETTSSTKTARWLRPDATAELEELGALLHLGPRMSRWAWGRSCLGADRFSLCGLAHWSLAEATLDAYGELFLAPFQPWDALVCQSLAERATVLEVLAGWQGYLADRFGRRPELPVQLPVIPAGVCCVSESETVLREQRKKYRARWKVAAHDTVVLSCGRFSLHQRAHPLPLLAALDAVGRERGKPLHLMLAGWFADKATEAAFRALGDGRFPHVKVGLFPWDDPYVREGAWHAADIYCYLADVVNEPPDTMLLKAMAAGLPVVVSDWASLREIVQDGIHGFTVPAACPPAGDGESLVSRQLLDFISHEQFLASTTQSVSVDIDAAIQALSRLVKSAELRKKMGRAGRESVLRERDWRTIVPRYEQLWHELTNCRRSAKQNSRFSRPHPLRPDPFSVYQRHATKMRSDGPFVEAAKHFDIGAVAQRLSDPVTTPLPTNLLNMSQCEQLVDAVRESPISMGDLLARFTPPARHAIRRTLHWLHKHGLVHFRRNRTSRENGVAGAFRPKPH